MTPSDCIEWDGLRMGTGYGRRYFPSTGYGHKNQREQYAHRAAWEDVHGPIPSGMVVHHRCENKGCINVDHLQLLTMVDHFSRPGHGKLTREDAETIREWRTAGWPGIALARAFGCSEQLVCSIFKGRNWA